MKKAETMLKKQWVQALLCTLAVLGITALPLLSRDLVAGHDAIFHVLRLESLADALRGGVRLPVRIYPLMLGGYGYAAGLFYPDVFLLPAALARAAGLGPELAFKLHLLLCAAAQCLTCYLAARAITRSRFGGCLFMVLYGLCQYHLSNLYMRSAVGELQAMIFLPLAVWGLWDLTEEGAQKPWLLFVGFTGLLLSHTVSLALMGLTAIVWVLVRLPAVLNRRAIGGGVGAAVCCLLVSASYWLPLLEQFLCEKFKVSEEPLTHLHYNVTTWETLLCPSSFVGVGLGGLLALAGTLAACWLRRKQQLPKAGWVFVLAGIGLALCTLGWFPWALVDRTPLASVQFPWRLHSIGQLFVCLGLTLLLCQALPRGWRPVCLAAAVLLGGLNLVCLGAEFPEQVNYPSDYFTGQRGETFYLVGAEWLPAGVDAQQFAFEAPAQWADSRGVHPGAYFANGDFVLEYEGAFGRIGVPKLYYKGYSASLAPRDGGEAIPLPLHKDGAGRVELEASPELPGGTITVSYTGTAVQKAADGISLVSAVGLLALGWAVGRKRRRGAKA